MALPKELQNHVDNSGHELGLKLIEILQLKVKSNGRVETTWGDKTPPGLALTVKRIMSEND